MACFHNLSYLCRRGVLGYLLNMSFTLVTSSNHLASHLRRLRIMLIQVHQFSKNTPTQLALPLSILDNL